MDLFLILAKKDNKKPVPKDLTGMLVSFSVHDGELEFLFGINCHVESELAPGLPLALWNSQQVNLLQDVAASIDSSDYVNF